MLSPLLRRCCGLALVASFASPAAALVLMDGMLNVCHGAIFALGQFFKGLQHLIGNAILAGELNEIFFAQREFRRP
jgi:hypothetical protein